MLASMKSRLLLLLLLMANGAFATVRATQRAAEEQEQEQAQEQAQDQAQDLSLSAMAARHSAWRSLFDASLLQSQFTHTWSPKFWCSEDTCYELVALQTYPGTGSTWLKRLYAAATGLLLEAVYEGEGNVATFHNSKVPDCLDSEQISDICLELSDVLHNGGLPTYSSPSFIKTHQSTPVAAFSRIVRTVRDPLDLRDTVKYFMSTANTSSRTTSTDALLGVETSLRQAVRWHCRARLNAYQHSQPELLVHYENLLRRPHYELARILHFVGVNASANGEGDGEGNGNGNGLQLARIQSAVTLFPPIIPPHSCASEPHLTMMNTLPTHFCDFWEHDRYALSHAMDILEEELRGGSCQAIHNDVLWFPTSLL
ncbi:hypothetical protein B484DRAFT_452140, partial [Ochromonadaceae sp. CCMP2298]